MGITGVLRGGENQMPKSKQWVKGMAYGVAIGKERQRVSEKKLSDKRKAKLINKENWNANAYYSHVMLVLILTMINDKHPSRIVANKLRWYIRKCAELRQSIIPQHEWLDGVLGPAMIESDHNQELYDLLVKVGIY